MANRFEQSTPPSIHDVYRGLPIGPGGIEPFIYPDRDGHGRTAVRLPWRSALFASRRARRSLAAFFGRARSTCEDLSSSIPCPPLADRRK